MRTNQWMREYRKTTLWIIILLILCILYIYINNQGNVSQPQEDLIIKTYDYTYQLSNIEAESFYVYDLVQDKVLFAREEHKQLPLASIVKLMTGFVILDILPDTTLIKINMNNIRQEGDSGLFVGETWILKNLLDFSLITSSNDGIDAITESLNKHIEIDGKNTIQLMNERALSIGMNDTIFINPTGLDIDKNISGAYSSAYDVTLLIKSILKDNAQLISGTRKDSEVFSSEENIIHYASNTNIIVNNIPGLLGSKTGFTDLAGGNLVVVFDAGLARPIVIVVLNSSQKGRFVDVESLVNITLQKLAQ
jgi:D-alanyl-D-alanine carboxypeptidase (penicillin-binding protein 5/6)